MLSAIILLQNLQWLVPASFMLGASPAFITAWGVWRLLSAALPNWIYVKGDDMLFATYHRNLLFFFEKVSGTEIVFYGDLEAVKKIKGGESCIYLSNHQSTADWVLGSSISLRRNALGRTRYVLKDGLKFLPLYGFYFGMHGSIFVRRGGKFKKDKATLQLEQDAESKKPMWLIIFPEGTRYNPELPKTIKASQEFAGSQNVSPLNNVLFPRAKATQMCVSHLKDSVDCVYDVTIAYGGTKDFDKMERLTSPTLQDLLMRTSKTVHIHIRRIPIAEVPSEETELKSWLYQRYLEKDRLLTEFYAAKSEDDLKFPGESAIVPLKMTSLLPSVGIWCGSLALIHAFKESRECYWKLGLVAATSGIIWMGLRY